MPDLSHARPRDQKRIRNPGSLFLFSRSKGHTLTVAHPNSGARPERAREHDLLAVIEWPCQPRRHASAFRPGWLQAPRWRSGHIPHSERWRKRDFRRGPKRACHRYPRESPSHCSSKRRRASRDTGLLIEAFIHLLDQDSGIVRACLRQMLSVRRIVFQNCGHGGITER